MLFIAGCASGPTRSELAAFQAAHDAFTEVCYNQAHETIRRSPKQVRDLYLSPPSSVVGAWEFELFFGRTRPRKWAYARILDAPAAKDQIYEGGTYELRYTYLPVQREVGAKTLTFHGVRQELIELKTGDLIAERENYIWGKDFNRSSFCIDTDWFYGNDNFADRLLGYRYRDESSRTPTSEWYVKAVPHAAQAIDIDLPNYPTQDTLPSGAEWHYNDRRITLRNGSSFGMPGQRNNEPIDGIVTLETDSQYVFVLLPNMSLRNWPLRELLLFYRDKQGKPIKMVFIQIPKFVDWSNGWGMRPQDVQITEDGLRFSVYGRKIRTGQYSDQQNVGHYRMRYDFLAVLPN